jgi:hypothetical protein
MPSPIEEVIKRRVIQQWLSGEPRDKIASDLQIGAGTVSGIVSDFKENLHGSDLDSVRELAIEARKQGLTPSDLAAHIRLHNFFIKSGAAEDKVESFIANVNSNDIPPERVIELVYQLHGISKSESIPLDQVANYVKEKLEEKQKIDEEIKEADAILQSRNVNIEAINEHIQLNERLNERGLSTEDIEKLLNLIDNAKEFGFDGKKIVAKLRKIKRLDKKEERLRNNCEILSKQLTTYKEILPLTELVHSMNISGHELISFKVAVNEAAEQYGFPRSTAAFYVINNIRDYNKQGQLKKELSALYLHKFAINEACSRQSQSLIALAKLKSYGLTEDRILQLNDLLENNGYKDMKSKSLIE